MLLELRAENYAVIDQAVAGFGPGLNLLTGETGAGKSILIDALALLLGGKASSDVVRHGAEKAVLGCAFETTTSAVAVLERNGIDAETGSDEVVIRREIGANGKGRVFVNNQPATVTVLRELAAELGLIHSQGETLGAFDQTQQRILLDRFAGVSTDHVALTYAALRATEARLAELEANEQDRLRMADLWRFQAREIGEAQIAGDDEDARLEAEKRVLANAEKLYAAAMSAYELLYENEGAAESTLAQALKHVEELARYDPQFASAAEQLAGAKAAVEDVGATVRGFADGVQASPERLEEIEDRLAQLDRLKRKYGAGLKDVIGFGEDASRKLAEVEHRDAILEELRIQRERERAEYRKVAEELSGARRQAAGRLAKQAAAQINELAMSVRFEVRVTPVEDESGWTAQGWDRIEYRIATNTGEPLKPLEEIASGGEMSRVMLALKVTVEESFAAGMAKKKSRAATPVPRMLVFDEIDIGIGGRAAEAVGKKLKALSRQQQVVCITHLPQIAAFADHHFVIEKSEHKGRTRTSIRRMDEGERMREIARMLSGATLTDTSLDHARQMMELSR